MNKRLWLLALLASPVWVAQAACPTWPTAERFTLNGAEVTDKRTGLVWARCSVGQSWSGSTCTGSATALTHEAALQHAATQSGWRLPNVKELASLADKGCINPAIDAGAFPAAPSALYWSSSPLAGGTSSAWGVHFYDGSVGLPYRGNANQVRLVRASQ